MHDSLLSGFPEFNYNVLPLMQGGTSWSKMVFILTLI